jgi:hypothetical protein
MSTSILVRSSVRHIGEGAAWSPIHDRAVGLLIEQRTAPVNARRLDGLMGDLNDGIRFEGAADRVAGVLERCAGPLADDIAGLVRRFAVLMRVDDIRLRLEIVTTNACTKWHVDYTDVRLVTTYAGAGTEYRDRENGPVERLTAGALGLFKGRLYGAGHATVPHRSPPIEGTGERRLVLVIDTPRPDLDDLAAASLAAGQG